MYPNPLLLPLIIVFSFIGVYAISNSLLDLWLLVGFGVLGFLMRLYKFPAAPMIMALVLGPLMENSTRQSLSISLGNPSIFVVRPISVAILGLAALFLSIPLLRKRLAAAKHD